MQVKFLIDWGGFKKGQVLDMDLPSFNFLINSNIGIKYELQELTNERLGKSNNKRGRKSKSNI